MVPLVSRKYTAIERRARQHFHSASRPPPLFSNTVDNAGCRLATARYRHRTEPLSVLTGPPHAARSLLPILCWLRFETFLLIEQRHSMDRCRSQILLMPRHEYLSAAFTYGFLGFCFTMYCFDAGPGAITFLIKIFLCRDEAAAP